jgi:hypothetical protein
MMNPTDERDEEEAFLPSKERQVLVEDEPVKRQGYLRLAIEGVMAIAIVVLLLRPLPASCRWSTETSPVPKCMDGPAESIQGRNANSPTDRSLAKRVHLYSEQPIPPRRYVREQPHNIADTSQLA